MSRILYISDLDGTLLNSRAELSEVTVNAVNGLIKRGMLFTYATARSFSSAGKITRRLNLNLPLATYNGCIIVNPRDGGVLECCFLDKGKIGGLLNALRALEIRPLVYAFIDGRERVSWLKGKENAGTMNYIKSRADDPRLRPVDDYDSLFDGDIFYFTIIGDEKEISLCKNLCDDDGHIGGHVVRDTYNRDEFWMEIFRSDATKASAVRKLKKYANADMTVCFGDNLNDLPMFGASDKAYAVSNAVEELKNAAAGVIGSNDGDGVVEFLLEAERRQVASPKF